MENRLGIGVSLKSSALTNRATQGVLTLIHCKVLHVVKQVSVACLCFRYCIQMLPVPQH